MPDPQALPLFVPALDCRLPLLLTVEAAGELAGLDRHRSYRAAQPDGPMPVLRVGQRMFVPTATWLETLGLLSQRINGDPVSA